MIMMMFMTAFLWYNDTVLLTTTLTRTRGVRNTNVVQDMRFSKWTFERTQGRICYCKVHTTSQPMFVIQESHNSTSAVNLRRVSLSSISKFIILHFIMHHLPLESNVLIRSVPQPNHENFCLLHYLAYLTVTHLHRCHYLSFQFLYLLSTHASNHCDWC